MRNNAVFLDANVLIEIILSRPKHTLARKLIEKHSENLYISALTAHLIVHFGLSIVALPVLREFLTDYTILPLETTDFEWAFTNIRNTDFEDALQLAIAIRNGCQQFVTFDKVLAHAYEDLIQIQTKLLK